MLRRAGLYGVFLCPFTGKPIRRGIPDLRFDSKNAIKTEEKQMGFNYAREKENSTRNGRSWRFGIANPA